MSGELQAVLVVAVILVVATAVVTAVLLVKVVKTRTLLSSAGVPVNNKLAFWGAILYVISPVDLMPDPILLDDIGVLLLALRSLHKAADSAGISRSSKDSADLIADHEPKTPRLRPSQKAASVEQS
ncbi:YkvA family protein [Streptomyces sp. 549]|uniref:YkvA family protein n=1 Tax=Streptomyces sp. 549 TaxID=3049076 RepID=UPI0024C315BC|nr:YkvA family protein [Streptomyces sp. 549]MDK1474952.1 YkvA family protein [Streptomyces sp. 549]